MINNIGIFIMGFAWGVGLVIIILFSVDAWLRGGKRRARKQREKELAEKQLDLTAYGYDLKECEECHLPGDCPLCGAE